MDWNYKEFVQYGWICPKCGRVMSPTTPYCPCNGEGKKTTVSTGTTGYIDWVHHESRTVSEIEQDMRGEQDET